MPFCDMIANISGLEQDNNDNSARFLSFCEGAQLRITGSWFRRKDINRLTWFSNDGRTRKEIDHILAVSYTHLTLPTKRIV